METSSVGRVITAVVVVVYLALRLPWAIAWEPVAEEPLCVGLSRHLVVEREWRVAPLLAHPPLASHVGGVGLWALRTPVEPWDPAGPATQLGWITLAESRLLPDDAPLEPRWVVWVARAPLLLLGLLGLILVRRMGDRIHGPWCGGLAALAWAVHPGLAVHGALAATEGLAATMSAVLLTATADVGMNPIAEGAEVRRRQRALGLAGGLAALASHALWPLLLASGAWLATRNAARRRRGDDTPRRDARGPLRIGLTAALVVWAGYLFEVRPALGADGTHPLTAELGARLHNATGLESGAVESFAAGVWLPAASWFRSIGHVLFVEPSAPWIDTLATLSGALPWGVLALFVIGLLGLVHLLRDRADLPALLLLGALAPLGAALLLPARLTVACALVATPAIVLLGASAIARLGARRRAAALVLGAAVVALFPLQWAIGGSPADLALLPGDVGQRRSSAEQDWQIARLAADRDFSEVHVVAGRPRGLTARGEHVIRDHAPGDEALDAVLARVGEGEPRGILVVDDRLLDDDALAALADVAPSARVGRLLVFTLE